MRPKRFLSISKKNDLLNMTLEKDLVLLWYKLLQIRKISIYRI